MKILKLSTLSYIVILILFHSCKQGATKQDNFNNKANETTDSTAQMKNNLPYTSDDVKPYYKLDADSTSYVVDSLYKGLVSRSFDEKNLSVPLKENDFNIQLDSQYKYYILKTFTFSDSHTAQVIIYNTFGENDSKILNVQLNSYVNNHLTDQLLLDCRFTFETEYYRTFKIGTDNSIEIVKHSVDGLEFNEAGDIVGEKKEADSAKVKVNYIIDSTGKFIKK
ncbi:hypothetical protein CHRYSEOSP005_19670 [Chryseobacterium sp. Alg-005]|uniref:hypothetical protein n=1 Tax=Chryseobacterium sp. Alg-005 TaxID=3159516 RepID=UPI003555BAD6